MYDYFIPRKILLNLRVAECFQHQY